MIGNGLIDCSRPAGLRVRRGTKGSGTPCVRPIFPVPATFPPTWRHCSQGST